MVRQRGTRDGTRVVSGTVASGVSATHKASALQLLRESTWRNSQEEAESPTGERNLPRSKELATTKPSPQDCIRLLGLRNSADISAEHLASLMVYMIGRVREFAMDAVGCHLVQQVLLLANASMQKTVVCEMEGHVQQALESPHANHVLQLAINLLAPSAVRFILDELMQCVHPVALARHPFGCRVLQRLIEHFPPEWLEQPLREILQEVSPLCQHAYGNFVVQHMLEHCVPAVRKRIVAAITQDIGNAATHFSACGVLDKALSYSTPEDQQQLAAQVLSCRGLLVSMACQRNGLAATHRLLLVAKGSLQDEAHAQLAAGREKLHRSKHGRAFISGGMPQVAGQHSPEK
mmetsp:Transcript_124135/g.247313  ORF Transcript_124135/g.247313 Transcript_124135/m.247313 type:complete len:349 (+) Transcript_124135:117-1163(+)